MEGTIIVAPEQLASTANEFEGVMAEIQRVANSMTDQVNGLGTIWEGTAATAYKNKFNQLNDDIAKLSAMIKEHVTDLKEMAGIYREAENKSEEIANSLPGDVIP